MSKYIEIKFEGKNYTLEYSRKSIEAMERQGFNVNDVDSKPMTCLPELFAGAFIMHHKFVDRGTVNRIFDNITNKEELIEKLAELYNEPLLSLLEEPDENEGNASWEANW